MNKSILLPLKNAIKSYSPYIGVIILAAGASHRMGRPKQLLKIGQETLIEKTIRLAKGLKNQETVVVLGAHAEKIRKVVPIQTGLSVVINRNWSQGMGTTLQRGVQFFLAKATQPDAIIIMVCDQPYLTISILEQLILAYKKTQADIIAAQYDKVKGVPALFSKTVFAQLTQLDKDEGARKIIKNYKGPIATIPFPGGMIDLDTPEAYQSFLKKIQQ